MGGLQITMRYTFRLFLTHDDSTEFNIVCIYLRCSNRYTNLHVQVDDKGYLQLVDFGFAKRLPSDPGSDGRLFTVCGTPGRKDEVVWMK